MNDLAIQLSDDGGKHLYEQIYEYIRDEIKEGKLLAGEKLPSTRSLAEYLQVARSTVELAYGQLLSEGYIESSAYRGYYISRVEELYQIMTDMSQKEEEAAGTGIPSKEGAGKNYAYDFSPNAIDMSVFPSAPGGKSRERYSVVTEKNCLPWENHGVMRTSDGQYAGTSIPPEE